MRFIDEAGMRQTLSNALASLERNTHLHVSFDVDFLDPEIAPAWVPSCRAVPRTGKPSCVWK